MGCFGCRQQVLSSDLVIDTYKVGTLPFIGSWSSSFDLDNVIFGINGGDMRFMEGCAMYQRMHAILLMGWDKEEDQDQLNKTSGLEKAEKGRGMIISVMENE